MNYLTTAIKFAASPIVAAKDLAFNAFLASYAYSGFYNKSSPDEYEKQICNSQKVSIKVKKIVKIFLTEKKIDCSKIMMMKNESEGNFSYSSNAMSAITGVFILKIPIKALQRIRKKRRLTAQDKYVILHEYAHDVQQDSLNVMLNNVKVAVMKLAAYSVSTFALSFFGLWLPVNSLISSGIAEGSSFLYANQLSHKLEFRADALAVKFGKEILDAGKLNMQSIMKENLAIYSNQSNVLSLSGDFLFDFLYDHPSCTCRLAAIEKIEKEFYSI